MTKLDDISEAIGALRAEVLSLRRDIVAEGRARAEHAENSDKHRAVIHRRMDDLVDEVGDLSTKVVTMESKVNDSKTVTDEVKQWKQRGIGALFVTGIASAAISSTVVGFVVYWWESIMRALRAN
ncbi:DUF1515 family protein [Mesorhizobium sp. CAU 1741]|uniref:DUF1515 family protein n=1 Tax=Mesorhizobium sp. CAU 1741 TaxID=3140366 RepID=UPI00325ADAA6